MAAIPAPELGYRDVQVFKHLGSRLKALREHHLLYKTTVAAYTQCSAHQIRRFESGKAIPRFDQMLRLATLFKVSIEYFAMNSAAPFEIKTISQRFADGHTRWR